MSQNFNHVPQPIVFHDAHYQWTRKEFCEDSYNRGRGFAIVVDGASPVGGGRDAHQKTADFAYAMSRGIDERLARPGTIRECVAAALAQAQQRSEPDFLATAAMSLVVWNAEEIAVASLADCVAVLRGPSGCQVVASEKFVAHEEALKQELVDLLSSGVPADQAYEAVRVKNRAARAARNTEEGQWVLASQGDVAAIVAHMDVTVVPRGDVDHVVVASDGAWACVDTFGLVDAQECVAKVLDGTWGEVFARQRQLEQEDADGSRFPRFSANDDATIVGVALTSPLTWSS